MLDGELQSAEITRTVELHQGQFLVEIKSSTQNASSWFQEIYLTYLPLREQPRNISNDKDCKHKYVKR